MTVNRGTIVLVVAAALVGSLAATAVHAQESKGAPDAKQPADIRMLLTQPQNKLSADSAGVPNLRDVPMPKMDKPPVQPTVTVVVGDARCYPGEDATGETRLLRRPPRPH